MTAVVPYLCESLLLRAAGELLRLPSPGVFTALTFLHKYRQQVPYQPGTVDWVIVAGCLYVAGKVEEAGASVNHLVNTILQLLTPASTPLLRSTFPALAAELQHHAVPLQPHKVLVGDQYYSAKEKLLRAEQLLLRHLRFDLLVDEPYKYCLNYCGSAGANPALCRAAVSLLNDTAAYTNLAITHKAPALGAAALHAAAGLLGLSVKLPHSGGLPWWHALAIEPAQMHELTGVLLDLVGLTTTGAPEGQPWAASVGVPITGEAALGRAGAGGIGSTGGRSLPQQQGSLGGQHGSGTMGSGAQAGAGLAGGDIQAEAGGQSASTSTDTTPCKQQAAGRVEDTDVPLTPSFCQTCHIAAEAAEGGRLMRCIACRSVTYCSRKCQRADWERHKAACKAQAAAAND